MTVRRWIALLAILGVLAHAGALLRHHGLMLRQELSQSLSLALSVDPALIEAKAAGITICSVAHQGTDQAPGTSKQAPCQVCTGVCASSAIAPPQSLLLASALPAESVFARLPDHRIETFQRLRPPGRGPPQRVA